MRLTKDQAVAAVQSCYTANIINNEEVNLERAYETSRDYLPDRRYKIMNRAATTPHRSGIAECAGYRVEWRVIHPVKSWTTTKWGGIPVYDYDASATIETNIL